MHQFCIKSLMAQHSNTTNSTVEGEKCYPFPKQKHEHHPKSFASKFLSWVASF